MASRPKPSATARETRDRQRGSRSAPGGRGRSGGTREAVREIIRRYRETFERLGR